LTNWKRNMPRIWTLGPPKKRTQFTYSGGTKTGATLLFKQPTPISARFFQAILTEFSGKTIPGGFSMTEPTPGGLGEWVQYNSPELNPVCLTPRHASFIAAILVHEGRARSNLKGNAVELRF